MARGLNKQQFFILQLHIQDTKLTVPYLATHKENKWKRFSSILFTSHALTWEHKISLNNKIYEEKETYEQDRYLNHPIPYFFCFWSNVTHNVPEFSFKKKNVTVNSNLNS